MSGNHGTLTDIHLETRLTHLQNRQQQLQRDVLTLEDDYRSQERYVERLAANRPEGGLVVQVRYDQVVEEQRSFIHLRKVQLDHLRAELVDTEKRLSELLKAGLPTG